MKTHTSENLWLMVILLAVIVFISFIFYFSAKKVVDRISHSIEPTTKQAVMFEIRG